MLSFGRVTYGELENATHEEQRKRLPLKFDALFPRPRPLEYKVDVLSLPDTLALCGDVP